MIIIIITTTTTTTTTTTIIIIIRIIIIIIIIIIRRNCVYGHWRHWSKFGNHVKVREMLCGCKTMEVLHRCISCLYFNVLGLFFILFFIWSCFSSMPLCHGDEYLGKNCFYGRSKCQKVKKLRSMDWQPWISNTSIHRYQWSPINQYPKTGHLKLGVIVRPEFFPGRLQKPQDLCASMLCTSLAMTMQLSSTASSFIMFMGHSLHRLPV